MSNKTFRRAPVAHAAALALAMAGLAGNAHAQRAFSAAWMAQKNVAQGTAAVTGYLPNGTPASMLTNPLAQQQKANEQLRQSLGNLGLAAQAIAAQQAAQAAARAAAQNDPSVPDGLADGGLKVDTNSLSAGWLNARALTRDSQQQVDGRTVVTVEQTADKAILNWETFNVGRHTTVDFKQQADWAVLNRVNDPKARPSQIQGQIKADGTVLIANRNGVVFSGSSQTDTRNLVAAAAHIGDDQFKARGIYSNDTAPSFTTAKDDLGKVEVKAGARLSTKEPGSVTQGGGYVLLLGKEVANAGEIAARKGQVQLAAGDSFVIRKGVGTEANAFSTTRGNEIAPQFAADSTSGKVSNTGLLMAREGDITLAGREVRQDGVALATSTVAARGTVHLLNSAADTRGNVAVGQGAVTAVLIEDDGKASALDSQRDALLKESAAQDAARALVPPGLFDNLSRLSDRRDQSRIEIVSGGDIRFEGDSLTLATGGQIAASATRRSFVADKARLDVSGAVGVNVSMTSNNVKVSVQGNETRDAPRNRESGALFNNDVWIDRRKLVRVAPGVGGYEGERWYAAGGLLEVGGYLGNQGHGIGEWAAQGGTVVLGGSEVVTQAGSNVNLSGGSLNVQTGFMNQTWLKGSDGRLYSLDKAPSDLLFDGVYKGFEAEHVRWGKANTDYFYNPLIAPQRVLENGYTVGRDAGRLVVSAPTAVLEGEIVAEVFNGAQQTRARDAALDDGYRQSQTAVARGGVLAVGHYGALGRIDLFDTDVRFGDVAAITQQMAAADALADERINTLWLDAAHLNAQHLSVLDVGTRGSVNVDKALTLADGGRLNLLGAFIDIGADITVRGGTLEAGNVFTSPVAGAQPRALVKDADSSLTVRDGVTLDLRGRRVDIGTSPEDTATLAVIDGGTVRMESTHGVTIGQGSLIDVSSGAALLAKGKPKGGKGGSVTLVADSTATSTDAQGRLSLGGEIRGHGVNGGGTLKLETGNALVIGLDPALSDATQLVLDASRLQSGFSGYDFNGHAGLTVAPGAQLDVVMPVYRIAPGAGADHEGGLALQLWTPPLLQQDAVNRQVVQRQGADLVLRSQRRNTEGGNLAIGAGAVVTVHAGRSIQLLGSGKSSFVIDGRLNAWGGRIGIDIEAPAFTMPESPSLQPHQRSVWIGEAAVLDVAARAQTGIDNDGRRYGTVRNGGTISIGGGLDWEAKGAAHAPDLAIVIRPGAVLDASGSHARIDVPTGSLWREIDVASDGGSIVLKSAHSLYLDGTLRAHAGGANAAGGTLAVALEAPVFSRFFAPDDAVRQSRELLLSQTQQPSGLPATLRPGHADAALTYGKGRLGVDQVRDGGFGNLSLLVNGLLSFDGNVDLTTAQSLRIYAGSFALADSAATDSHVRLASSYLRLAGVTGAPTKDGEVVYTTTWRHGASTRTSEAVFTAEADHIDIRDRVGFGAHGEIALTAGPAVVVDRRGFETVNMTSRGDLRLLGGTPALGLLGATTTELATMGDLTLTAAQIYPATGANAQIRAGYDTGRVLDIRRQVEGDVAMPQSAFGILALGGDTVRQGGIVRAPLGNLILGQDGRSTYEARASLVDLLPGSITSVSGAGLLMPYGGTTDGIGYSVAGTPIDKRAIGTSGILLTGDSVVGQAGALLDLSGGGELTGAGFVSGRGGSVDVLRTPLANANPANTFSQAGNGVYAIVPGFQGGYAPVSPDAGAGEPAIGRQVTLDHDVGGLKAGTYTLLPSTYALLPGAFRVEVGAPSALPAAPLPAGYGSYVASGYLGVANTAVKSSLASPLVVTPAAVVKQHATYNEMGYDAFVAADAARRGGVRGEIAADARNLQLDYFYSKPKDGVSMLQFDGTARFNPAAGSAGFGGTLSVTAVALEVTAPGAGRTAGFGGASVQADQLNAFGAPRMIVGGRIDLPYADNYATFKSNTGHIVVRSGATLRGAEIFLVAGGYGDGIQVEQGASLNTLGAGAPAYDSTDGVVFSAGRTAVLGLSNGWINLMPPVAEATPVTIQVGICPSGACSGQTTLYGEGTLAVATNRSFTMADTVRYGAKNLLLAVSSVNLGSDAALQQAAANGQLPSGLSMNQGILANLLAGNKGEGVPAVETLVLNARESVNIYGAVSLDTLDPTTGVSSIERLVLGTPAIYGYGGAGDTAKITTGEFIWTGLTPRPPGSGEIFPGENAPGGAIGSLLGHGTLDVSAARIVLGHAPNTQPDAGFSADRLALGFGTVNLNASERITANAKGTLGVYEQQGAYVTGKGYEYTGGQLNLRAPLLTGEAGSNNRITAGGDIVVSAPAGAQPAGDVPLGAQLALTGRRITIDGTVGLPSGKLQLTASGDVTLTANSRIDLAGQAVKFFEQTRYSRGGDLEVTSTAGNIVQAAGSVIDLSATHNRGGTMQATALGAGAGRIDLGGRILGTASGAYDAGGTVVPYDAAEINVRGQTVADFAGLNTRLNEGGVTGARRFQIKQGDLAIGDEVKARVVEVTLDGGSLTVNGRIDASGFQAGAIRLAAKGDLTVNGTLDAHATGLRVDSYGKIIDSPNRAIVDLTSTHGTLTLGSGVAIDLRAGTGVSAAQGNDGAARGTLALNAPRRGDNDVAIGVNGTPAIQGAKTIAVNAFRTYSDAPLAEAPDVTGHVPQLITQKYLDEIDGHSSAFIDKALANTSLSARLAGLGSYHLRPGVEIVSQTADGDLSVVGDIDLSGYRYGPGADRNDPARRGFGEPGVLVIRAGGNLNVYGSINDGFAPPPATPDDKGWYLTEQRTKFGTPFTPDGGDIVVPIDGVVLDKGTVFPKDALLNYDVPAEAMVLPTGTVLPVTVTLGAAYTLPAGTVLRANVYYADGSLRLKAGTVLTEAVVLDSGMQLGAGTALRGEASVQALVWPKGVRLPVAMKADGTIALARGALIPSMTDVQLPGDAAVNLRPEVDGVQGRNWAVAPMLGQGATSWSLQLTAGADLESADRRAVDPAKHGALILADSHAMYNVRLMPGGTGFVWGPGGPALGYEEGTPVGELEFSVGYCDWGGPDACKVDPTRLSYFWGPGGVDLDPSFVEGTPVLPDYVTICEWGPSICTTVINPVKDVTRYTPLSPMFSVLRTGTGDLGLAAAGNLVMESPFGVYTAGTRSAPLLDPNGLDPFNLARGNAVGGSVIGPQTADYSAALAAYQAWYPEHGGNLDIAVGGNVVGDVWGHFAGERAQMPSAAVGNWLWRQGSGTALAGSDRIATSWWINFGTYALPAGVEFSTDSSPEPYLVGFTGMGTLGGGNLTLRAGGDAGLTTRLGNAPLWQRSEAIVAAVGSTGRVDANGQLTLTGGGDLQLRIGGVVNPNLAAAQYASAGVNAQYQDLNGALVNLRGAATVSAAAIGGIELRYRKAERSIPGQEGDAMDTRPIDPFVPTIGIGNAGIVLVPGDSAMYLDTPGDLVLTSVADAGRARVPNSSAFKLGGTEYGIGQGWFTLWTDRTAINLFSAGGNLTPGTDLANLQPSGRYLGSINMSDNVTVYPSILRATAASGSLYHGFSATPGTQAPGRALVLAPSASGALEFLAGNSLFGGGYPVSMSGAVTPLPTPWAPAFVGYDAMQRPVVYNTSSEGSLTGSLGVPNYGEVDRHPLFAFGPDTLGSRALHAADAPPSLFYAAKGDILGLASGTARKVDSSGQPVPETWYRSAAPARIRAGRDIVGTEALIVNNDPRDVSLIEAGRDILYANVQVAGPGALEISAGRHITQDDRASVVSRGALAEGDTRPGASIAMMAGMGAGGPDFSAIADRYLDPAKRAESGPGQSLASQPGRVVKTYDAELAAWLKERYGFVATSADVKDPGSALAYFKALAPEQQRVFLRGVYFAELRAGGREYNDVDGPRYGSYLRGRGMIATLFPDLDAAGQEIVRTGDIILYGPSGVHTDFGGDIQMLAPGGQIVVGVQGAVPPGSAGVITQGSGHIQLFSEGSLLLGLSRVMTTFGGDVLAWSEQGDINAGRGSKTTLVYTPPKRVYDNVGNVKLSSQVPSSGAGLATLAPIAEVPAGDMDLIAPLGTIDAGEAGIRVSGSVNLAALQVVNAANIQVKGQSAGLPVVASVNVGALSNASAAASQATAAAQDVMQRERAAARQSLPSVFSVRVLGFGNEPADGAAAPSDAGRATARPVGYDESSPVQVLGRGPLGDAQKTKLTAQERRLLGQ
ncbi:filamentous hemagglutinin N-terminal domain-containing protein [Variovorax paradoxus]|uniref:Filamentous hemagglutinin N-terminal domain-containing protein n=1 Tax=Variovorax paradoxus TaxID=34073 RepID=A0A5Q0M8H1_VARPD|nr:filamentous haemagglutinin family protein [Variovorax paradoxus]QFZ84924.1 filamentous hemagglutinin N-terminal domain-containing protein [Variovorax paradoxus]